MNVLVMYCDICGCQSFDAVSGGVRYDYGESDPSWGEGEENKIIHLDDKDKGYENLQMLSNPNITICWDCHVDGTLFDEAMSQVRKVRTQVIKQLMDKS